MAGTEVSAEPVLAVEKGRRRPRGRGELLSERQRNHTIMWVLIAVFLLVWQFIGQASVAYQLTIGTPTDVFAWIVNWARGEYSFGWSDLWITLQEAVFGYFLGTVIGVALAVLFSSVDVLRQLLMPFVAAANAVPKIAMAPLFVLAFGTTVSGRAYFVSSLVLFISFFAVFNGLKAIDRKYLQHVAVLGASWRWTVREVYLPAIIGWLVTSLRLSWTWAISAAVFIEYLSSNEGMGAVVAAGQESLAVSTVIGALAVIAIVAKTVDSALVQIESRMKAWRPT